MVAPFSVETRPYRREVTKTKGRPGDGKVGAKRRSGEQESSEPVATTMPRMGKMMKR